MGKKLADLEFSNRLYRSLPFLFTKVKAEPLTAPKILHVHPELLHRLELDPAITLNPSFLRFLNGDLEFDGPFFGASFYSGHQFGHYVPRLGDGRAMMIGEVKTVKGEFYEWQLKGSGLTPFSRMGDGKAVVRSSLREYLASAHLFALGIPTTEALALISGEGVVYREENEKEAIVLRVAESFLRFGHLEYYAHTKQWDELKALVEFVIENYFTHFADHPNRFVLFLQEVTKRTAKLFARWQAVGFCHGVLNTDNMSILGLTLDYGPYGFIDRFDLNHICNHSDHEGRYSLGNQPAIGKWNLEQLSRALGDLLSPEDKKRVLETYPLIFQVEYRRLMLEKCGLIIQTPDDDNFLRGLLQMLSATQIDYTQFFRALSFYEKGSGELKKLTAHERREELLVWLRLYDQRLDKENFSSLERQEKMLGINPKFILRNYLAQMAIVDHSLIPKLFEVLTHPFLEWEECEAWSLPVPKQYEHLSVSCSS